VKFEFEADPEVMEVVIKIDDKTVYKDTGYKITYEYSMPLGAHKIEVVISNPLRFDEKGVTIVVVGGILANPPPGV
jgi:hypothetical protein